MILLNPENEIIWNSLAHILNADIFTAVHITITPQNADNILDYLQRLADMGVGDISLTTNTDELNDALEAARSRVASLNMSLVWDIPVPYSTHNPVALEIEREAVEHPAGAGRAWLYVEPDGDVTPTQGNNQVLGNLLDDPWEKIWKLS